MKTGTFTVVNDFGIDQREACRFVDVSRRFSSVLTVSVEGEGFQVAGRAVMELMLLAAGPGSRLNIRAIGCDEEQALKALGDLVENEFYLLGPGWRARRQDELYRLRKQIGP